MAAASVGWNYLGRPHNLFEFSCNQMIGTRALNKAIRDILLDMQKVLPFCAAKRLWQRRMRRYVENV